MRFTERIFVVLTLLVIALAVTSLMIGSESISLRDAVAAQWSQPDSTAAIILREIRVPRMLIAAIIENPLASPGLVGSASGAALGAVSVLYFGNALVHTQLIPVAGMSGSLLATLLVYVLAGRSAGINLGRHY